MNIWFISDTHFGHENILKFKADNGELVRGNKFSNIKEMDDFIIHQWNSIIKPQDRVYHLGDVGFGDKEYLLSVIKQLNGSKRLILGNHDDVKFLTKHNIFKNITMWRMFTEINVLATHVPVHQDSLYRRKSDNLMLNVHGHTHQNGSPEGNYKSVCVEMTNYLPVNYDELIIN